MSEIDLNYDFGFSLVDEKTLKANEIYLRDAVTQTAELHASAEQKFDTLYKMVMPLLRNLQKDPEKQYVYWPDRVPKIEAFIQKLEALRES